MDNIKDGQKTTMSIVKKTVQPNDFGIDEVSIDLTESGDFSIIYYKGGKEFASAKESGGALSLDRSDTNFDVGAITWSIRCSIMDYLDINDSNSQFMEFVYSVP